MLLPRGAGVPKYNSKGKPQRPLLPLLLHGKDFFFFLGGGGGGYKLYCDFLLEGERGIVRSKS